MDIEKYKLVDQRLYDINKIILFDDYKTPINLLEEKEKFLSGEIVEPNFEYKRLEFDSAGVRDELNSVEIPQGEFYDIFFERKKELLLMLDILDRSQVERGFCYSVDIAKKIWGYPSVELVERAKKVLREGVRPAKVVREYTRHDMKKLVDKSMFELYKLGDDWSVNFRDNDNNSFVVLGEIRELRIPRVDLRKYSFSEIVRLPFIHEVGVHVLRCCNGYLQPLKIFALGTTDYLATEEGLAIYFQEKLLGRESMYYSFFNIALNVIGTASVARCESFSETFSLMKEYGLSDSGAFNKAYRFHRLGGQTKDKCYLDGYFDVKEFDELGGDFRELYVGKVPISYLEKSRELIDLGVLVPAVYVPKFLDENGRIDKGYFDDFLKNDFFEMLND